ncbi:MAG: ABC transporter ATP-binding protein, partial [Burkholderiales bacterium]
SASVMQSTVELVKARALTTLMVTHNMEHALRYSSRIVMMNAGRIQADLNSEEKLDLSVADLVRRFHVADDRMALA